MSYLLILNYIFINFLFEKNKNQNTKLLIIFFSLFIFFFISFRYEIGGDWFTYEINYDLISQKDLFYALRAYSAKIVTLIIYLTKNYKIFTETLFLGVIFSIFYIKYLLSTKFFFLSAFITFPVFVILGGMGYVHQGVALIISWQIFINYPNKSIQEIIFYVVLASLFHTSALIFILFLIPKIMSHKNFNIILKKKLSKFLPYLIFFTVFIIHFFDINPYTDLYQNIIRKFFYYVQDDYYKSNGTIFRLLLFLPSIVILSKIDLNFFKYKKNFELITLFKLTVIIILVVMTTSIIFRGSINFAFVDRICIGMIFFQVYVTNIYYDQFKLKDNIIIDLLVYFFPFTYTLLWINFSKYTEWWIPYNNILFFL